MDVSAGVYLTPLIIESALLLLFLFILATRGTRRGRNLLLIIFVVILFFMIRTFTDVLLYNATPLGPPPDTWEEGYYDSLFMRSVALMKAQIDGAILLFLFISFMCGKYQEALLEEKEKKEGLLIG